MRVALAYAKASTLDLGRYTSFSVPTLLFPGVVFLVFGARRQDVSPNALMASYVALAVLSVAFFQFGVGIAGERASAWQTFLRSLPAPTWARLAGRILSALVFGVASATAVVVVALTTTDAGLSAVHWGMLAGVLLLGGAPFALLGVAIGYWLTPRGALPTANLLYLSMSYLGGLWTGAHRSSGTLGSVSSYVPTRLLGGLLDAAVGVGPWRAADVAALAAYAAVFAVVAAWGYRRDEGERFS